MALSLNVPEKNINNLWYHRNDSSSVVVFVHGILSDSRSCWLSEATETYWPQLVIEDQRLQHPSVFLGGFYTAVDAGKFDISDCAKELFNGLSTPDGDMNSPPLDKKRLVFICHSTGGIIVRYMLSNYPDHFRDKEIGLLLIASPSLGSKLANVVGGLLNFYDNQLGLHLEWGNDILKDIDDRFKELLDRKVIPRLAGVEACENHFILHRKWLPDKLLVVERESAGRYFAVRVLPNTDHFSTVKPTGFDHPAHKLLVEFWVRHYGPPFTPELRALLDASREGMRARNLPYFTPALLLALLHPNGFASSVFNSVRPNLARELRERFHQYLESDLPASEPGPFRDFDWFDREEVQYAQRVALQERLSSINERILLKAVLLSKAKTVTRLKEQLAGDFDKILVETDRVSAQATPGI